MINASRKPESISQLLLLLSPAAGFPDLRKLLQLTLTISIANVAAERSLSCLRRIRTYVRSSMKEQTPSGLANLSIATTAASKTNYKELVDIFAKLPILRDPGSELSAENFRRLDLL